MKCRIFPLSSGLYLMAIKKRMVNKSMVCLVDLRVGVSMAPPSLASSALPVEIWSISSWTITNKWTRFPEDITEELMTAIKVRDYFCASCLSFKLSVSFNYSLEFMYKCLNDYGVGLYVSMKASWWYNILLVWCSLLSLFRVLHHCLTDQHAGLPGTREKNDLNSFRKSVMHKNACVTTSWCTRPATN